MKKTFLLFALLCASVMGWGLTPYCNSEQVDDNGNHYFITIKNISGTNTYVVEIEGSSTATITGKCNINCGMSGGINMAKDQWEFDATGYGKVTRTFEYASTPSVVGANNIDLYKSTATGSGDLLRAILPTDADWTSTCSSGGGEEPGQGGGGSTPATVTEASCTTIETGYRYTYSNDDEGAVTLVVTLDAAVPGYATPLVYNASNQSTSGSTSDGKVFTFSLGTFSETTELSYRTYFPYTGGVFEKQWLTYTVGTSCSSGDEEKPSMENATVEKVSQTSTSVVISITGAEDNVGVTQYVVKNHSDNTSVGEYTPSENQITISGLSPNTEYNWDIYAKDNVGNVSDDSKNISFTTDAIAPKTYNGYAYSTDKHVFIKYTITRTSELNLTFSIVREVQGITGAANPYVFIGGIEQGLMTGSNGSFTYTKTGPFADGAELAISFKTPYAGGDNFVNFNYIVASEQAEPTYPVGAVVLNKAKATKSVGDTETLTATVYPSFATNAGTITWASGTPGVATVDAGVVTAVAAGTANITATCGEVTSAPCVVTVVASLEEAKYYGCGAFVNAWGNAVAYDYCFTRASDSKVTLSVVFSRSMNGLIGADNFQMFVGGVLQYLTYDDDNHTATYNFGEKDENTSISYYFYLVLNGGGVHLFPARTYTVGSSNTPQHAFAIGEKEDNTARLTAADTQTFDQVFVARSFEADNLYTLVLPFNVDAAQTATVLPGQLTKLNNTIVKENEDLRINFVDVDAIEAGVPYLYTPSQDVTNPTFSDVTISKDLNPTEPADGLAKYYGIYAPKNGEALHAITNGYVLGNDQYLYATAGLPDEQQMYALRGYFVLNFPTSTLTQGRRARVVFNEGATGVVTDVEAVTGDGLQVKGAKKLLRNGQLLIEKEGHLYNAQGALLK